MVRGRECARDSGHCVVEEGLLNTWSWRPWTGSPGTSGSDPHPAPSGTLQRVSARRPFRGPPLFPAPVWCAPRDSNPEPAESCEPVSRWQRPLITAGHTGCNGSHRQPLEAVSSPLVGQFVGQTSERCSANKSSTRRPTRLSPRCPEAIAAAMSPARAGRRLRLTRAHSSPRVLPGCSATS